MRRAPGPSRSAGSRFSGILVGLLAVAVIGGTTYGYARWQEDIATVTATDPAQAAPTDDAGEQDDLPDAPTSAPSVEPEPAYEPPTFEVLEPSANRPQPVVLLVGDGYAAGRGASGAGTTYASLLARDLGWDVRIAAQPGAGYVSPSPTLLDLFLAAPTGLDPDLVLVQGAYGSNAGNDVAKDAVVELAAAVEEQYAGVPVVAVTAFSPGGPTSQTETRERTVARAWREDPDVLVLRPQLEGWSTFDTVSGEPDDAGHALIAETMIEAFRTAGLVSAP